jgi:hypothetical protein
MKKVYGYSKEAQNAKNKIESKSAIESSPVDLKYVIILL